MIPTRYELYLDPNLDTQLFNGTNRITINVLQRTNEITLHSNYMDIISTEFQSNDRTINVSLMFELYALELYALGLCLTNNNVCYI